MKITLAVHRANTQCGSFSPDRAWGCVLPMHHRGDCYNISAHKAWCSHCGTWRRRSHKAKSQREEATK